MEISKLIHDNGNLDIDFNVNIYKTSNGEYTVFISQDCTSKVPYDISHDIKTTDEIGKCVKEYLETYYTENSGDEEKC